MAKQFSLEFKQQAIDYALANSTCSSKRPLSPEQQRILELEKEVKQLKDANDILKKAHLYFLSDHINRSTR